MQVVLSDVMGALGAFAPPDLAEAWDRPGLQVGDPGAPVNAVLVSLDPSRSAVQEAIRQKAQLLVTHHPLLLKPLHRVDLSEPLARLLGEVIEARLAVYCAHTNLDRADGGVNDALAARFGLEDVEPLAPGEPQCKVVVTVPAGYEPGVRRALCAAGAGRVGRYEGCSFGVRGQGTFVPGPGSDPFLGQRGSESLADESRIEVPVPRSRLGAVVRALREVHPYEEPAVDVYALEGRSSSGGLGRIGTLRPPRALGAWAQEAARALGSSGGRLVGPTDRRVERVALCGGSGAELWSEAVRKGAQVLVTGDVKYHVAREAEEAGLALLDLGHAATERTAIDALEACLTDWAGTMGADLRIRRYEEPDPFTWIAV